MGEIFKRILRAFAILFFCVIVVFGLFVTGIIEKPLFIDITKNASIQTSSNNQKSTSNNGSSSSGTNAGTSTVTYSTDNVPSALKIQLSGTYLETYKKAIQGVTEQKPKMVIKIGLQILQSKTIIYENKLHFYSLEYKNSGGTPGAQSYNLKDCIDRINSGKSIYTDCFGFVRLTHSIAAYTLNPSNPDAVSGLNGLYNWRGSYGQGQTYYSLSKLKHGAVIYDCLTGSGDGCRHVAMFLYNNGNNVTFMDQNGIRTGTFNGSYIFTSGTRPYKFNKFKNYC